MNHVLELHQGDTIDEFRVLFDMDGTFTSEIDSWLLFSLKKKELKSSHCIYLCSGVNIRHYYNGINIGPISSIDPNGGNKSNINWPIIIISIGPRIIGQAQCPSRPSANVMFELLR